MNASWVASEGIGDPSSLGRQHQKLVYHQNRWNHFLAITQLYCTVVVQEDGQKRKVIMTEMEESFQQTQTRDLLLSDSHFSFFSFSPQILIQDDRCFFSFFLTSFQFILHFLSHTMIWLEVLMEKSIDSYIYFKHLPKILFACKYKFPYHYIILSFIHKEVRQQNNAESFEFKRWRRKMILVWHTHVCQTRKTQ